MLYVELIHTFCDKIQLELDVLKLTLKNLNSFKRDEEEKIT